MIEEESPKDPQQQEEEIISEVDETSVKITTDSWYSTLLPRSTFSKVLILASLAISIALGYLGILLHLTNPCPGCGIGGVVLIPFYIAAIPVLPAAGLMHLLPLYDGAFYSQVLESYSLIKLIPIWIFFLNAFLVGYLLAFFSLKVYANIKSRKSNVPKEYFLLKPKLLGYYFIAIFVLVGVLCSGYALIKYPVAPFVDDEKLSTRIEPYIFYKFSNCEEKTNSFTYPFKFGATELDNCIVGNFIKDNPYKDVVVSGLWLSGPSEGRYSGFGIKILDFFAPQTGSMSQPELREYCNSFSPTPAPTTLVNNGLPLTYVCELELNLTPRKNLSEDYCKLMLHSANWYDAPVQNACMNEYVHMTPIQLSENLFDEKYPNGWEVNESSQKLRLGLETDDIYLNSVFYWKIIITKGTPFAEGSIWDEVEIFQYPISSPENRFIDTFNFKQLDYTGPLKRINLETFKTKNENVYIEYILDEESGEDYIYVHFLTTDSYVRLKGPKSKVRDLSDEEAREVLLEIAYHVLDVNPEESVLDTNSTNTSEAFETKTISKSKVQCTDSDGGEDIYVSGITTGADRCIYDGITQDCNRPPSTKMDMCKTSGSPPSLKFGTDVIEYYCGDDQRLTVNTHKCPNGCLDGACVR